MPQEYYRADRSPLTRRVEWRSIHQARSGGEPMARLSLSQRQCGELEQLVSHTPLAKERCRAQALLWIAEGSDVAEVAVLLKVSRLTIYNWLRLIQARG